MTTNITLTYEAKEQSNTFKVNDVVDVRLWVARDESMCLVLDRGGKSPEEPGTEKLISTRILALHSTGYVCLMTKDMVGDRIYRASEKLAEKTLNHYGIHHRFKGEIYSILYDRNVVRKNDKKSYEIYQQSDLEAGATCRGPCRAHNKFANPDKGDTYLCRACKAASYV